MHNGVMADCPLSPAAHSQVTWKIPLPKVMYEGVAYPVVYEFSIDHSKNKVVKKKSNDIPHANIHSCIASRGELPLPQPPSPSPSLKDGTGKCTF